MLPTSPRTSRRKLDSDKLATAIKQALTNMTEPDHILTLSEAVDEFFVAKRAERLSENTLAGYSIILKRFLAFEGPDKPFHEITVNNIRAFLADYPGKKKNVKNAWVALSSMWTWAAGDGLVSENIVHKIKPPEPEEMIISPLSHDEFQKLMNEVKATNKNVARNQAMLLLMLDTGVRASELCGIKIGDIRGNTVRVFGKGSKEREIPISASTMRVLLDYLSIRRKATVRSPLFAVKGGGPFDRNTLLKWMTRLGDRAGVPNVHPHKLRHTFAINFLRNGGDAISLQHLLGHTSLDMVKLYVHMANDDLKVIHRRASPVENWELRP